MGHAESSISESERLNLARSSGDDSTGAVAVTLLREMLDRDALKAGQRRDLEYILKTLEDLAAQLKRTGKYAEETAGKEIDNEGDTLDEKTRQWLLTFTKRKTKKTTFKTAATAILFGIRTKGMLKALRQEQSAIMMIEFDPPVRKLLEGLNSWNNFDVFKMHSLTDGCSLQHVAVAVLDKQALIHRFNVPMPRLRSFLAEMERTYLTNPYHTSMHAADVTQSNHLLLRTVRFSELENLSSIFAAICHDAGHPGVTNDFRVRSNDDCAITYNDRSVNENMHCALTYRLLKTPECDWLECLSADQRRFLRKVMIGLVLGTDMAAHFLNLEKFRSTVEASGAGVSRWENSELALEVMLHAADISNACKPLPLAVRWADLVLTEFFQQGDCERELHQPISPLCDRTTVSKEGSQIGFINFIVRPLFEALSAACEVQEALENLAATEQHWIGVQDKKARQQGAAPIGTGIVL